MGSSELADDGNPNHLKMLRQGVAAGNTWRKPDITPDLYAANLYRAKLERGELKQDPRHITAPP